MRRSIFILMIVLLSQVSKAQDIKNQFQLIGEAAIPVNQSNYSMGWGLQFKWLHRLGPGELTVDAGFTSFRFGDFGSDKPSKLSLIPFLAGYRFSMKKFFVEPQLGYGAMNGKEDLGGDFARPSVGAFFYGVNAGYQLNRFDVGIRYLGASGAEGSDAGPWHDKQFSYGGFFAAFNLRKSHH